MGRRYKAGGWSHHHGGPADQRMTEIAAERGVILTSVSRPLLPKDLSTFDYIIGMVCICRSIQFTNEHMVMFAVAREGSTCLFHCMALSCIWLPVWLARCGYIPYCDIFG